MQYFKLIFIFFLLTFVFSTQAQEEEGSKKSFSKKNAITVNLLGTSPILGVNYERLITDKLSVEFGAGLFSLGLGLKFYPMEIKDGRLRFHLGYTNVLLVVPDYSYNVHYVPIGLTYFGKKRLIVGLDIGGGYLNLLKENPRDPVLPEDRPKSRFIPYGNIKIGYRF